MSIHKGRNSQKGKKIVRYGVAVLGACLFVAAAVAQYPGQHLDKLAVATIAPMQVESFDLQDVRLLNSPFKSNMQRDGAWLVDIGANRLLFDFRVNAGMKLIGNGLGGWERMDSELRGHTTGHALSGLSLLYASTGNALYKHIGDSIVSGLAEVQQVLHQDGYLSAFPQNLIGRCIAGKSVWAPWYTLHKIMAGLLDMYTYGQNKEALVVAEKMAGWAYKKLTVLTKEQLAVMLKNEFGGMGDAFYNLYAITGNKEHLALAALFYNSKIMDPLADHRDELKGLHANTQIPKIVAEARAYELTGQQKSKTIAEYFWNTVVKTQTYATGGNSDKEHFLSPGAIATHLTGYTQETCNTYNMLKLTRHLFCWTGSGKYMDYYERALYNDILPQQDTASGMVCYFTPMLPGAFKVYSTKYASFWCCVGSSFESHAKYGESIYYHDKEGLYVALFIPSTLNWKEKGLKIRQETKYPESPEISLTVEAALGGLTPLYIRYPSWATSGVTVKVNGKLVKVSAEPGSFLRLTRKWRSGDKVELNFPMSLRLIKAPDNPSVSAIAYGPLVLAAREGMENIEPPAPFSDSSKHDDYYTYDYQIPDGLPYSLKTAGTKLEDWIRPVAGGDKTAFEVVGAGNGRKMLLEPFYKIHRGRYNVYWQLEK